MTTNFYEPDTHGPRSYGRNAYEGTHNAEQIAPLDILGGGTVPDRYISSAQAAGVLNALCDSESFPVNTSRFNTNWIIKRPIQSFGWFFAVLSLLFCVATPFMDDITNWWRFLLGGFGYSAFLSFFSVGLCLLPFTIRVRVFTCLFTLQALCVAVSLTIFLLVLSDHLTLIRLILTPLLWALGIIGAAFLTFSFYGWYFRFTHDYTNIA